MGDDPARTRASTNGRGCGSLGGESDGFEGVPDGVPGCGWDRAAGRDPFNEAGRMLGIKAWQVRQLVDQEDLTMLIDADAPKGWAWRWLLLRSEVEELAAARRPGPRDKGRGW